MKTDLISRLNKQISQIDTASIRAHIDKGDLDDWIEDWRIETAAVSFGLFSNICGCIFEIDSIVDKIQDAEWMAKKIISQDEET